MYLTISVRQRFSDPPGGSGFYPIGGKTFAYLEELLKDEARHLAVCRKFDSELEVFSSFWTLFWTLHMSIVLKFLFHIICMEGNPLKTGVKKSRRNVVP